MRIRTALLPLLVACSAVDGPAAVENRREQWLAQAPAHYQVDQDISCFCVPPRAVRVEVRDNQVVAVTNRETGAAVPHEIWGSFYSVQGLFDLIEDARKLNAEKLEVTYHPTDHYPTSITIDYRTQAADDELWIKVLAVTSLP